jgi:uncharacterized membrane-anchored protein
MRAHLITMLLVILLPAGPILAQDEGGEEEVELTEEQLEMLRKAMDPTNGLGWELGPTTAAVGRLGEIDLPEGYRVIGPNDSRKLMEAYGNLPTNREQATVMPVDSDEWFFIFEFDPVGYVKDEEDLDPDDLLETLKEGNRQGNLARKERGLPTITLIGWEVEPRYNPDTNNLEWATTARAEDGSLVANHRTKILGRHGVMEVILVCDPSRLSGLLPPYRELLADYRYTAGNTYAEYVEGDKIAEYGLAALITGGAVAVAAKTGLLARFWKFILAGLVAIGAFFKKMFGGGKQAERPTRRQRPAS